MTDLSPLQSHYVENNVATSEDQQSITDRLAEFIATRLPKAGQPLAGAASHHFAKPGKMLRAKMALRASQLYPLFRGNMGPSHR